MGGGAKKKLKTNKTDWENYYAKRKNNIFQISNITRKITQKLILDILKMKNLNRICELGGGDSCFYRGFRASYPRAFYCVFDNSPKGVHLFNKRFESKSPLNQRAYLKNILQLQNLDSQFDLVFSVGLIEHFNTKETKEICQKHFSIANEGGLILITYPTPTWLYRFTRGLLERFGMWKFHDERPLRFSEVNSICSNFGELKARRLNWAIFLTQEILVYEKFRRKQ